MKTNSSMYDGLSVEEFINSGSKIRPMNNPLSVGTFGKYSCALSLEKILNQLNDRSLTSRVCNILNEYYIEMNYLSYTLTKYRSKYLRICRTWALDTVYELKILHESRHIIYDATFYTHLENVICAKYKEILNEVRVPADKEFGTKSSI